MEASEIITTCRRYLGDEGCAVFVDSQLGRYMSRAVSDYFKDTGYARGEFPLDISENGEIPVPNDYCGIVVAYNDEGRRIIASTISRAEDNIPEYSTERGEHVETIYRELSNDGKLRVSPIPTQQKVVHNIALGESGYGMVTQMYGCAFGFYPYGATTSWTSLEDKGSIVYARMGDLAEITDGLAIVYHMLAQCYAADTDLMDAKIANAYGALYKERVATRITTRKGSAFTPRKGNFY